LTHDIDTIKKWTLKKFIKETIFNFEKKSFLRNFFNFFGSMIDYKSDPYFNFEKILAISDKHNIKSVFLFMALKRNEFDFRYPLKKVKSFLEKLSTNNNHSFGLHLSRLSYNNPVNASKEVERFKSLTKMKIKYNRQHYLMFDVNSTWKILDEHDITYDLSLGYPEMPGFRCGICYPFHTFDIINKKKLDLVEIPLIIMDVTLFDYLKDKNFKDDLNEIINNVKRYNGVLNILWHNDNYDEPVFKKNKDLFYNIINN
ncbi:MAG: hypothetical protein CMG00_05790, partial [Candidatus Marinimicrobia bacterium]|nr:hypothetical protein [Candidatus Neomarinimicrobiota bacterium]